MKNFSIILFEFFLYSYEVLHRLFVHLNMYYIIDLIEVIEIDFLKIVHQVFFLIKKNNN
jgi:hypothetical protein